jgi:hypothetical protein
MGMKYLAYTYTIDSDVACHFPESQAIADIFFKADNFIIPKTEKTKIQRAGVDALYGKTDDFHYLVWPGYVDFKINKTHIFYRKNADCPEGLFRVFITSEALGICLFLHDCYLLHGSAVVIKNEAHVFIGTPGAGKSSTVAAYAKEDFTVLSDDMVAIQFADNQAPVVLPAGPEIKIWKDTAENLGFKLNDLEPAWEGKEKYLFSQKNFPSTTRVKLSSINIILKPFSKKYKDEIKIIQSPMLLLAYFPLAHQLLDSDAIKDHFEKSIQIFNSVKFSYIRRTKTFQKLKEWVKAQIDV